MKGATKYSTISPLLLFSITILLLTYLSSANFVSATPSSTNDFIRTSCKASSTYPDVCVLSLETYARSIRRSPRQLAHVALSVSATRAHDTSNFLSGVSTAVGPGNSMLSGSSSSSSSSTASSFDDCMAGMARSADMLQKSVKELRRVGRYRSRRFALRVANTETWVSAALSEQNACLMSLYPGSGVGSGRTGAAIRKKVEEASRMTSNALAFVNLIGSRN